ncbi:MAG: dephospho-CoA kinase [Candidatus Omnitrophica bacterium]|nr:dephospho-CoA kinase [Candidatus Omnitrophota bacterium]MCM8807040.1 dephospho-CoA kinase [Candidatus Omnitrophota bacterium]
MKNSLVIGITGILGSGKTTVCQILRNMGFKVISCDEIVHQLLEKKSIIKKIEKIFGKNVILKNKIDRKKLRKIIFENPKEKEKLENLLHPFVFKRINREILDTRKNGGIIFIEIPLLFETKSESLFDKIIVVKALRKKIKERLKNRYSEDEIKKIWKTQLPLSYKEKKSDFVIDNSGSILETEKKIKKILLRLKIKKGVKDGRKD